MRRALLNRSLRCSPEGKTDDMKYILGIDQSTQGTKLLLFDEDGEIAGRADRAHRQWISERGYISHDLNEIYSNILDGLRELLGSCGISGEEIQAVGISNQRETTCAFDACGHPLAKAIVWQCGRAANIAKSHRDAESFVFERTGLRLSPYYPASKMQWLLENELKDPEQQKSVHFGTIDTYLICRLTHGVKYVTDATNASRTQLCDIQNGDWDEEILRLFHINQSMLPDIIDSSGDFGETDFEGILPHAVPICAALGDSHAALFGQNCRKKGMIKATYGTGSSIMMNTGRNLVRDPRLSTSVAWKTDGKISYCLEGNINYTGAVITWLKDDLHLIRSPEETETLALAARAEDHTVIVPAFSGLGAPHWNADARASIMNMSRTTGRAEIVRAALDSIAQQVTDVVEVMEEASGQHVSRLRVDGGPTRNRYLMDIQSMLAGCSLDVPDREELSAVGAAYMAGMCAGIYNDQVFSNLHYTNYICRDREQIRRQMRRTWYAALDGVRNFADKTAGCQTGGYDNDD